MKVTDPDVIKNGEKDLIDAVLEDLDMDAVRQILKERMTLETLESAGGNIIVHNNDIAFKVNFQVRLDGSLLFDRQGNLIDALDLDEPDTEASIQTETEEDHAIESLPDEEDIRLVEEGLEDTILEETSETEADDDTLPPVSAPEDEANEADLEDDLPDETEFSIDLPEYDLEEASESSPDSDLDDVPDITLPSDDDLPEDSETLPEPEPATDDMDEILKESRDFWEQKNDS